MAGALSPYTTTRPFLRLLLVAGALTHVVTGSSQDSISSIASSMTGREGDGGVTRDLQAVTTTTTTTSSSSGSLPGSGNSSDVVYRSKTIGDTSMEGTASSAEGTTRVIKEDSQGGGGQRYDLVAGVSVVAVVIIAALLFVMRRNNKKTRANRDFYKSSSEEEPQHRDRDRDVRESMNSMSSTWKVGNTNTRTQLGRPSSPTSTTSTTGASSTDSETLNAIWRDPVIAAARLPFEEIRLRSLLCRGAFGEVFDGVYNGQKVAIKRLLPETRQNIESLEYFMLEVRMMASLNHARVVMFIGVAWDAMKDLCIISEFMANGDLRKVIQKWKQKGEPTGFDPKKLKIALHVAEALVYLHSLTPKKIIHRDLKSRNVLVDENWDAKLSDFGVSRERSSHMTRTLTANIGSSLWMAPEIMLGENYDESADIFSFGVVLTELDTHLLPYHNVTTPDGRHLPEPAILHMVTMGSVMAEFSEASRGDIVALGRSCLCLDPTKRPSAAEIVLHIQTLLLAQEKMAEDQESRTLSDRVVQ